MTHNIENIPADWIKPADLSNGVICTKKGNVLFPALNDYSYPAMLRELAFRVDYLSAKLKMEEWK